MQFSNEKEVIHCIHFSSDLIHCIDSYGIFRTQLLVYQNRLELLKKQSSPLRSFARFIKQGLSRNEIDTINSIQHLIQTYLKGLADNIATNPYGWKFYGKNDEKGEAFDFYPSLFVDRLKQQMKLLECRLQFQEMMAYSQLFVEFVDGQRKASLSKEVVGKLIANWIYQQWKLKKMLKNNKSSRSIKNSLE